MRVDLTLQCCQFTLSSLILLLSFLYDFNKDKIQSIALYDMEGNLIVAEPVTLQKDGIEVLWQSWFENAAEEIENMHFSTPHMQNLFQDDA